MANTLDTFAQAIKKLFPKGPAWRFLKGSDQEKLLYANAHEALRIEERGYAFRDELDPTVTFEMLDNWERLLKIPDECTPAGSTPSLLERRLRVLQKLTTGGGQSPAFYKLIAQQLGYDIGVLDVEEYKDFRAGIGRAGERISNSTAPNGTITAAGWAYTFAIRGPASLVRYFRAGQSVAGDRLLYISNDTLECVIRKFAPAHTIVLFLFED